MSYLLATTLVAILATVLVLATDFILLIFLGILLGVFLTTMSRLFARRIPLGYEWNLAIVTTLFLVAIVGSLFLLGAKIESRLDNLSQNLDSATEKLNGLLAKHPLARNTLQRLPYVGQIIDDSQNDDQSAEPKPSSDSSDSRSDSKSTALADNDDAKRADKKSSDSSLSIPSVAKSVAGSALKVLQSMMTTTLGLLANIGLIFFVGLFLAVSPELYRDGFAKLFPIARRQRVVEVMNAIGDSLFSWLTGRFISMAVTGGGTGFVLFFLGVPMAITLGVITGLLTFIPNIGGILALGLSMLMALPQGPMTVLWVVIAYSILQLFESNILTPIVMQQKTSIPPALLLSFQVIVGALTGFLGLMVATPVLAASLVVVKQVWIHDTLKDHSVA
ncbi:MAG: AI-2E family transporter [Pirellulaceae bacterium]|nr:AI-2E family transporter [Pirellulaceae bacterium]